MTPTDDLRALAERLDGAEDIEDGPYRIVHELDVLAAAKALRALAAAQQTPQEPNCHWCKHYQGAHSAGVGPCAVQHCPCVRYVVTDLAHETPAPRPAEDHDSECESELTSHGYTPCRCADRPPSPRPEDTTP